ncbi:Fur family transcriptional regulator [Atopobacter phocae]|uniref:Fur family transcriptional regulator n=1 Tax=Atopobacter phocae TaxID=136492 RepID=UPI0004ADEBCB|nr:Fur family transcriptional regulator [Atopobacter phocae]
MILNNSEKQAHYNAPQHEHIHDDYEFFLDALRDKGVRITEQRKAVIQALLSSKTHPTAIQLHEMLLETYPTMSLATVYNNLNTLIDYDLIIELQSNDGSTHYDYYHNNEPHYHAICSSCGKIVDFKYPVLSDVELVAQRVTGFQKTSHQMEIHGICPECQEHMADLHPHQLMKH